MRKLAASIAGALMILIQVTGSIVAAAETKPSAAQSLSGTVEDSLGRPIKSAKVMLKGANGRLVGNGITDAQGRFIFAAVPPGTYELVASRSGFKTGVSIVNLGRKGAKPITIALAAEQALSLEVVAKRLAVARNGLNRETGGSVYRFSEKAIQELPQGANTSMTGVLMQAPGVAQDSFGQLHIRGEHAEVQYRIDGIELPEGVSSGFSQTLSPRFAQSISLLEGALPAQYGYHTAGVVQIQTKNGERLQGGDLEMYGGQHSTMQPNFETRWFER